MEKQQSAERDWFTIFRTDEGNDWLCTELAEGRLRQGWGASGLGLVAEDGEPVDQQDWQAAYKDRTDWGNPSPRRFAILRRMLELDCGDIVVVPKMPAWDQFTIARASGGYRFELAGGHPDFGHVIPVDPESVRTFGYRSCKEALLISGLFSRANHWSAVSFCGSGSHLQVAERLMEMPSSTTVASHRDLWEGAINDAFRAAAESLAVDVEDWNGYLFEEAVRQCFVDQGYEVKEYRRYDGEGGDMDMVVAPPESRHGMFLPSEIAVQVKWKQGVDEDDAWAVAQIDRWAEWQESSATKYVISSATGFTEKARETAAAHGVVLVGGLQTMCFLLGMPDRYRAEWDVERR
ncbi:MAG: restriction endonuclease [Gammaproteobacteria bacterium]|nr:restriction endonuclease [Gammaproteobacteria bacterium]MYJ73577.1 restriction endonuclease [Gammaproteobacteria bacterium]